MDTGDASVKLALEEADIGEIEEYFTALEQNLDYQQQLLKEQQEQHHLELIAVERLRVQERMEWEREWREREEALLSTLGATLVSRERLMGDIRSYSAPLVSIKHLAVAKEEEKLRKWTRLHKKPQATSDAAPQDAHSDSSSSSKASEEAEEEELSMQELIKLEERVRKAEAQKLLKVQRKAEQKAKKAERRQAKEETQMEKESGGAKEAQPKRFWNILSMGCASSASHD